MPRWQLARPRSAISTCPLVPLMRMLSHCSAQPRASWATTQQDITVTCCAFQFVGKLLFQTGRPSRESRHPDTNRRMTTGAQGKQAGTQQETARVGLPGRPATCKAPAHTVCWQGYTHLEVSVHDGRGVCVQVQQPLQDLEGPALDRHVTDVPQVLLPVPAQRQHRHTQAGRQADTHTYSIRAGFRFQSVLTVLMCCLFCQIWSAQSTCKHVHTHMSRCVRVARQ